MAAGFSRVSVRGFRRLKNIDLALRPLNVLIGANAVGKSSVLDVFRLLAASASSNLAPAITDLGGINSLLTRDGNTKSIEFYLQADKEAMSQLRYDLRLTSRGYGHVITHEVLSQTWDPPMSNLITFIDATDSRTDYWHGGQMVAPTWEYKHHETALSQVPILYPEAERFRRLVADVSEIHHALDVSLRAPVRQPQTISPAETPGVDGENLVSALYSMRETARERFDAIEDALRVAFPTFDRLNFPSVAAGRFTLAWHERGFSGPFYPNELSEGVLRFLWLATLLQSPGLPKITLIDEPEVSLHPEMLRLLADLMREASERAQLVVATHSDRLVRFLEPSELIVCDRDESGGMTVQRADELDLKQWLEDYTLDQLWSKGILGGKA